jgi:hypothetical protein
MQQPPNQYPFNQQPTMPNYGYPPVPPPPSNKPSLWQRYKTAKKPTKIGIGCATLFIAFLLCGTMSGIMANATGANRATILDSTATTATTQIAQSTTAAPTDSPTALTVKPTNTPAPKPTIIPTIAPTEPPVIPTSAPTQVPPAPTQPPTRSGIYGNPWGYDLTPSGNLIYNPPADFCTYFNCIKSFWESTNGYVDECADGMYSHSGGVRGACSRHGGEAQPLYSH